MASRWWWLSLFSAIVLFLDSRLPRAGQAATASPPAVVDGSEPASQRSGAANALEIDAWSGMEALNALKPGHRLSSLP
jgi:hypothetical protein